MHELDSVVASIRNGAGDLDRSGAWPVDDLADLASIDAMQWAVPADMGGLDLPAVALHQNYETIAAASLSTALIVSQRDSAIGLIDRASNRELRSKLLAQLNANQRFSTIGIAQTTTSRQAGAPALLATPNRDGFQLNGIIPWATGADRADFIVVAAAVEGGGRLTFALPNDAVGLTILPPMPLVALAASRTTGMELRAVQINRSQVLNGPDDEPRHESGRKKALPIGQSFLALGLCRGTLELIGEHQSERAKQMGEELGAQLQSLRGQVLSFSEGEYPDLADAPRLRGLCNDFAVRITHAAVALYKGTALRLDHPAQRLAREAMFLLVWSCPDPVIDCTVELLTRPAGG